MVSWLVSWYLSMHAMRARSRYFHWRWPDDAYPSQSDNVRSVLLPFDNYEAYDNLCQTTWCSRSSWRWCFPGLATAPQLLPAFRSNSWTGFSMCRTPLHGWSSKLVVRTTFSRYCADYTGFGCQNAFRSGWQCYSVSLPPRLCTWLPGFISSARVTPQRTSTTALFMTDMTRNI